MTKLECNLASAVPSRHGRALTIAVLLIPIWFGLLFYRFLLETKGLNALWYDNFDSRLILWIFERNFLAIKEQPLTEFWNANQFYPIQGSLAFSDSIIAGQIIYFPMRLLGFTPLESLYVTFFFIIFIASYLIVWIGSEFLKLNNLEWMIFCFICQFSLTTTTFLNHYQLFAFQLAPAFFLLLYSMLVNPSGKKLIGMTVLFITICSFATYFAPMSVSVCLVILTLLFLYDREKLWNLIQTLVKKKHAILVCLVLLGAFFYIQLLPYVDILRELPRQNLDETSTYSASLFSILTAPSLFSSTYKANQINGYWEYSYFPGFVIFLGVAFGIFQAVKEQTYSRNFIKLYMAGLFFAALILSLGPFWQINLFANDIKLPLPFYFFAKIIPGVENIRAPGRFGAFLALPLGYFFIVAMKLVAETRVKNFFWLLLILILLIYDARVTGQLHSFTKKQSDFIEKVAKEINYREPTLILPLHKSTHFETILNYIDQLHISNHTGAWVVAGYGAKGTETLSRYTELSRQVTTDSLNIDDLFCIAKSDGIVNIALVDESSKLAKGKSSICDYKLVLDSNDGVLYRLSSNGSKKLN